MMAVLKWLPKDFCCVILAERASADEKLFGSDANMCAHFCNMENVQLFS